MEHCAYDNERIDTIMVDANWRKCMLKIMQCIKTSVPSCIQVIMKQMCRGTDKTATSRPGQIHVNQQRSVSSQRKLVFQQLSKQKTMVDKSLTKVLVERLVVLITEHVEMYDMSNSLDT